MSIQIIHRPYKSSTDIVAEIKNVNPRNVMKAFREMRARFESETVSRGSVGRGAMWIEINGAAIDVVDENEMYMRLSDREYSRMAGTATEFADELIKERT